MQELFERGGLELLAAFVAVADSGSFTEAARKLSRDASVISRRVSQLEEELGVSLFSRTTRRVVLTEVGARYHRRVQGLLEELSVASREASDIAASPQGLLRVSVPVTFGRQWITPLLPPFLASHPHIRLDIRFSDRFVDVVADGFDVAIRVGRLRDSTLTARKIASYRNLLVAAPAYLKAHGKPRTPDDLKNHSCIGFSSYAGWPDWSLWKAGKRRTIRPQGPLVADNSEAVLLAAIAGAGITFTADWLAGPALKEGTLVEVLPRWGGKGEGGVYAVLPPGRLVPAKTRLFVDEVSKSIKAGWAKQN
ncbi:LysR family transcriptional regulator [Hyphomicrobium sp.]|uniref:LysR family transcriptional regulator n=1 Tax=Hyphomicrobium sp. TaxID=82 RepID=UPI002FDE7CC0